MKPMELEVQADIESYSSGANSNRGNGSSQNPLTGNSNNPAIDNTPTNAEVSLLKKACDDDSDLESLYPSVPLRTSSILPRPGTFYLPFISTLLVMNVFHMKCLKTRYDVTRSS